MNFLKKLLENENLIAKIVSALVACTLWLYVMTDQNPIVERSYDVRLRHNNLPASMVVFNAPDKVRVRVCGSRVVLNDDAAYMINASLNLENVSQGQQTIPVAATFTMGDVVSVSPDQIFVYIDTISEKKVPVEARLAGTLADDMTLGGSTIVPSEVTVKGPSQELDRVAKAVAPLDVTGHNENFTTESTLMPVTADGYEVQNMAVIPKTAMVDATLVAQTLSTDLPVESVLSGNLPQGVHVSRVEVLPEKIRLAAPPSILKGMTSIKTKPIAAAVLTGSTSVNVELDVPDKVIPELKNVEVRFSVERQEAH
ncbi:MAG: hypothetical protein LUD41_06865 [Phascolarctobacterium sp.]|nr:hypothetical protein [Phascolarctobacterium sp.]